MSEQSDGRRHPTTDEPFVVFVIGMHVNRWRALHRWVPVAVAMRRMQNELDESDGLLESRNTWSGRTFTTVQYWTDFESLREYARDPLREHVDAWREYNGRLRDGSVGVFHETYRVDPDAFEAVYVDTPELGLAGAVGTEPASGGAETAGGRFDGRDDDPVVEVEP
ncbi:DUF4188 domain-containing protein [Halorarius halobius]|uniref:DUF4188 domain-containing protein n=1 Tax=Halorarius halobius TaxID=2962671 RepID=UPI0020CE868E|nr:DUF4188 domain-containing protein [Halorarius halobius]